MPKQMLVYKCLVVSPSDVNPEREAVVHAIESWNAQVGTRKTTTPACRKVSRSRPARAAAGYSEARSARLGSSATRCFRATTTASWSASRLDPLAARGPPYWKSIALRGKALARSRNRVAEPSERSPTPHRRRRTSPCSTPNTPSQPSSEPRNSLPQAPGTRSRNFSRRSSSGSVHIERAHLRARPPNTPSQPSFEPKVPLPQALGRLRPGHRSGTSASFMPSCEATKPSRS
jgi:hypothetical protein